MSPSLVPSRIDLIHATGDLPAPSPESVEHKRDWFPLAADVSYIAHTPARQQHYTRWQIYRITFKMRVVKSLLLAGLATPGVIAAPLGGSAEAQFGKPVSVYTLNLLHPPSGHLCLLVPSCQRPDLRPYPRACRAWCSCDFGRHFYQV